MKIESVTKFTPVVITLESQDEVEQLRTELRCSLQGAMRTHEDNRAVEYSHALSRQILEACSKLD